mmetsp:Transcript_29565/g.79851  ORF Transcript_29565/g.79851 Transcript_29565/m.79851 type:complete len:298 (-) Transcript_29565:101-994(-)
MAVITRAVGLLLAAACPQFAGAVRLGGLPSAYAEYLPPLPDAPGTECTCKAWEGVYSSGMAECGQGMEVVTTISMGQAKEEALKHDKGCYVYPKLKANFCMKAQQGAHLYGKQDGKYDFTWCYVSHACKKLGGGMKVNNRVSWKTCVEGEDTRYGDLPPAKLLAHAEAAGLKEDPSVMALMSYPYIHATWLQVQSFFTGVHNERVGFNSLNHKANSGLQDIVDSGKPMMICTGLHTPGNGRPDACGKPHTLFVVVGKEIWYYPRYKKPQCVQGCATTPSRAALADAPPPALRKMPGL